MFFVISPFEDSTDGRQNSSVIISRAKKQLIESSPQLDHGLTVLHMFINGYVFYDQKLNSRLKMNKFFMLKSPTIMEFLKQCTHLTLDATFTVALPDRQLGIGLESKF